MSAHPQDDLLAAALDGSLSEPDRDAVEAHLAVCAQCRDELEVARGARDALRGLPTELHPPIDLAAAVSSTLAGERPAAAVPTSSMPRWYRAAGLVAAAAAIVLAIVVLPDLGGRDVADERATTAMDAGAEASPDMAGSEAIQSDPKRGVEVITGDLDLSAVARLADEAASSSPTISAPASATSAAQLTDAVEALDCVRSAAGAAFPPDSSVLRMISATYLGTPAYLGVATLPDRRIGVWVAARDDCRLLAAFVTPS